MPSRLTDQPVDAAMTDNMSASALPNNLNNNGTTSSTDAATITLTFGGVDFRLVPTNSHSGIGSTETGSNRDGGDVAVSFLRQVNASGAELSLKNFTGTLRVELATAETAATSAAQTSCATSSPVGTATGAVRRVSPGNADAKSTSTNNGATKHQQEGGEEPSSLLAGVHDVVTASTPQRDNTAHAAATAAAAAAVTSSSNKKKTQQQQGVLPFAKMGKKGGKAGGKATPAKRNGGRLKSGLGKVEKKPTRTSTTNSGGKLSLTRRQKEAAKQHIQQDGGEIHEEQQQVEQAMLLQQNAATSSMMTPVTLGQTAMSEMTATQMPPSSQLSQPSLPSQSTTGTSVEHSNGGSGDAIMPSSVEQPAADSMDSTQDTKDTVIMDIDDDGGNDADANDDANVEASSDNEEEGAIEANENEDIEASADAASDTATITRRTPSSPIGQKGKHHPCARWGQTMTLIDHGRILVYGGQTFDTEANSFKTLPDIHVYDMSTRKWTKPVSSESVPRTWHSATFLPERQLLISFGGDQWNEKTKKVATTDEVMVLDTDIMLWYPPSVSGQIPSGRSGHTASLLPHTNELVVFGGVKNNKWQNSVAVLDTTRWKWSVPKIAGSAPRPRSYHTATAVGASHGRSRLVIFGGNDEAESFDTVHVLDASNSKMSWFHPVVSGTAPSARSGHIATLLEDNKTILIYGGWDLNLDEEACKDDADMIFEDSFLLDTELWTWSPGPKIKYDGSSGVPNGGSRRVGHSAVLAPSEEGAQVLVFGGRVPGDEFSSDFQKFVVP
mmetsp:Transcript_37988/g.82650  ORF Transcript_37988/g.82650 Transcript_37988/m.82650 type:complete len:782 (-) Transcript_37988:521-2866(-)